MSYVTNPAFQHPTTLAIQAQVQQPAPDSSYLDPDLVSGVICVGLGAVVLVIMIYCIIKELLGE